VSDTEAPDLAAMDGKLTEGMDEGASRIDAAGNLTPPDGGSGAGDARPAAHDLTPWLRGEVELVLDLALLREGARGEDDSRHPRLTSPPF
jgi:hypothetical protein